MERGDLKLIQRYHDKAKTKLRWQYHVDQFGKEQGESKRWYDNGQIARITNFKDGTVHGKRQQWCKDGRGWYIETRHFKKRQNGTKIEFK